MRVKRLEIQGFKSFKDKTVIHFDHSITGIVGPNGCGKSNIVDAFFWVMGEQSYKHMRGASSEDLIFNGSTRYTPLGLAEATLVLETDVPDTENAPAGATAKDIPVHLKTKEISVTRRVYRTGEGEYFINGVQARLKDIHELFMDTGVGAKGYSVIEQGQIGKIVNAKPEDRRLLIEEAAGIAKYKARKKESLRKIDATQTNLSRLTDVIQEIERNLASLERQAQKARQYKKYKEELLDKEMTWGRRKSKVLRQKLEAIIQEKEALEQELVGLKAELQTAENTVETDRVDQLTQTKKAEDLQVKIQEFSSLLTREQSALELSRRRQGDLATQLETLQTEERELQEVIEKEETKYAEQEELAQNADSILQEASEKVREKELSLQTARKSAEDARKALDDAKKKQLSSISQASELTSRSASLASRVESARAQAEKLRTQAEEQAVKVDAINEELSELEGRVQVVSEKKAELAANRTSIQEQFREKESSLKDKIKERDEARRKLMQLRSKLQSLEELAAAYEGFGDGPKAALDWAKASGNAERFGVLTDLFDVEAGFEPALEGWLEQRLESLFSTETDLALQALEQVSEKKQGRVSIQLLSDSTSGADVPEISESTLRELLVSQGFAVVGPLKEHVTLAQSSVVTTSGLLESWLGQVMVVEDFAPLTSLLSSGQMGGLKNWSLVSRDGTAVDATGLLRGGSIQSDRTASVLGRKRAIADLLDSVKSAESIDVQMEAEVTMLSEERDSLKEQLDQTISELQAIEIEFAGLERDVHSYRRATKEAQYQLESLQSEHEETESRIHESEAEQVEIQAKMDALILERSDMESGIAEGEARLTAEEQELRVHEESLQEVRVEEASFRERASSMGRELQGIRSLLEDRKRRLEDVRRILERAFKEREQHSGGDQDLEQRIEELTRELSTAREELAAVKDHLEQASATLNDAYTRIKTLHSTGDAKTSQVNRLALEIEKISSDLSHLVQNLEEKYGPGCLERPVTSPIQEEMDEPVVTAEMSEEEERLLGEEVERLRERIRRLGEVNVMAIEEFEETRKRYDYLLSEQEDLKKSIQNLEEAIEHINKTSEDRFKRAFEAIADRFERLFPIIFGGGQAKLTLVYPEGSQDVLEAGIDILAQPPGKKVVNITLLSGGEKALTAVSLIFAIFMVKPSPFCVLDEVDAPLDDANIGKFNALLREMSAKSQFIVITHNKKTMELNDTLYGVTMEEPGVSKMVSIEIQ